MDIIYFSRTKNIERFIKKSKIKSIEGTSNYITNNKYILLTYTDKFGEIPKNVEDFLKLKVNQSNLIGVIGSGNKNWGKSYCNAVTLISQKYNVPILQKFELSGKIQDIEKFKEIIKEENGKIY